MIKFINKYIPLKGYEAMAIWPFFFISKGCQIDDKDMRHEYIHAEQQKEMLWIGFFLWYGAEWLIRLIIYRNKKEAYYNISLEQEAYISQWTNNYLDGRKHYAWTQYLRKKYFKFPKS